jgi:hypothetical protein
MKTRDQIFEELKLAHPVVTKATPDGTVFMPENERLALLSSWAQAEFDRQAATARKTWPTVTDFWQEFTAPEQLAIANHADPVAVTLRTTLSMWRGEVWSDDARVQGGLNLLVSLAVITPDRKTEILTP